MLTKKKPDKSSVPLSGLVGEETEMSRLEVVAVDEAGSPVNALDPSINAGDVLEIVARYENALAEAEAASLSALDFPAIELFEKPSKNFQYIHMIFEAIRSFQGAHALPEHVRVICPDRESVTMYKQVYNFYYPGTKAERMDDDAWD